jgi:uncharacterized membrane protein
MVKPRCLVAITTSVSCTYATFADTREIAFVGYVFFVLLAVIIASILLPAVWSRKKYRRDASYGLIELITRSSRMRRR